MPESSTNQGEEPLFGVHGLPPQILETYARLWQLETWLRQLVYVQLRAKSGDAWHDALQGTDHHREKDKRLVHMPTEDESPLSFAQLSQLTRIIGSGD